MNYTSNLIKIKKIEGMFYSTSVPTDTITVYGIGAPIPPDSGTLPDAPIIMKYQTDLYVPDYIGYGRSAGMFTPNNCINTFLSLYKAFTDGSIGINNYSSMKKKLKYKRIIFIGRSFGGTYIPLLPKYNTNIKELAIFCPVVDSKSCGTMPGEETNKDFLRSMKKDGYYHLYRGILNKIWVNHLENKDDLSPMDNINYLRSTKLFIAHGKQDICVHYSKSIAYYNKILGKFHQKKNQIKIKIYPNGNHGSTTTNQAVMDFFKWIKVPLIQ